MLLATGLAMCYYSEGTAVFFFFFFFFFFFLNEESCLEE